MVVIIKPNVRERFITRLRAIKFGRYLSLFDMLIMRFRVSKLILGLLFNAIDTAVGETFAILAMSLSVAFLITIFKAYVLITPDP